MLGESIPKVSWRHCFFTCSAMRAVICFFVVRTLVSLRTRPARGSFAGAGLPVSGGAFGSVGGSVTCLTSLRDRPTAVPSSSKSTLAIWPDTRAVMMARRVSPSVLPPGL